MELSVGNSKIHTEEARNSGGKRRILPIIRGKDVNQRKSGGKKERGERGRCSEDYGHMERERGYSRKLWEEREREILMMS